MTRGFTLLESLLAVALLAGLTAWALPSFQYFRQDRNMARLASGLLGYVQQAKSMAKYRHQDLWVHLTLLSNSSDYWALALTNSDQAGSEDLAHFSGKPYQGITLSSTFRSDRIKIYALRGKITSGSITFYSSSQPERALKLITSYGAGRVRICAPDGEDYGYPSC